MRLDPRTHLFMLILASILALSASDAWQLHVLVALSSLYLIYNNLLRAAVYFVIIYIALLIVLAVLPGFLAAFGIILYTFARMMPMVMIGAALMQSAPSRIMCAFERASFPKPVLVMVCILIRFFPGLLLEIKAIRDGIRARGIFPHWYSTLRHPLLIYECFFVPLIVRCLKLSSELSSSAELRGIECSSARTSLHPVSLKPADGITVSLYALVGSVIYRAGGML